jgi:protein involved in polysaccharide export with SLBB domain
VEQSNEEIRKMKQAVFIISIIFCLTLTFPFLVNAQTSPRESYIVGIKDKLNIDVAGHRDLSKQVTVAFDGTISVPYLGPVYVEGKTIRDIRMLLEKGLGDGYVKSPVITIALLNAASKQVYIQGVGVVPYEHNMTVEKVLLVSGKFKNPETIGSIIIRRKPEGKSGYEDIEMDIRKILEGGEEGRVPIKTNDIIIIKGPDKIFIQGEVVKPGSYPIKDNMTIGSALSVAGGIKEGAIHGKVNIRRIIEDDPGYKDIVVNTKDILEGDISEKVLLQVGDVVRVKPNESFFIHGEVNSTGKYVLEDNTTVVKALTEAGGIKESGLHGQVKIRRKRKNGAGYEDIKVNLKGIIDGSIKEDVPLYPDDILIVERNKTFLLSGEVNNPGEYVVDGNITIGKALTLAGGIREGSHHGKVHIRRMLKDKTGYDDIKIDLRDILEGGAPGDMILQADDVVTIKRGKTFVMWGEVNNIGEYSITPDMTVFKAILMAGGFNKWGSPRRIKILRPNENGKGFETIKVNIKKLLDGDASADFPIQAGDIVIVSSSLF